MPAGRPSLYRDEYCDEIVAFCQDGLSITAFAGSIGVNRDTISQWAKDHDEFSVAVKNAKSACAYWWEKNRLQSESATGGQITAAIFSLKNHAPDDFRDKTEHELTGKDGGPIEVKRVERVIIDPNASDANGAGVSASTEDGEV